MRRANGSFLVLNLGSKDRLPIWSGRDSVDRYRMRNPELRVFLPVVADRRMVDRVLREIGAEREVELFLLSSFAPDAEMRDGNPVPIEELFPAEAIAREPEPSAA